MNLATLLLLASTSVVHAHPVAFESPVTIEQDNSLIDQVIATLQSPDDSVVLADASGEKRKDLNDVDVERRITDFRDVQIFTTVSIGSQRKKLKFIFDTGSSYMWMYSRQCANCGYLSDHYNERDSSKHQLYPVLADLHYGSGSVYGYLSSDQVCLSDTHCTESFQFINVIAQSGLSALRSSGVIGMSPKDPVKNAMADMFLDRLKEGKAIDQRVFSLYINTKENQSMISYGGYNMAKYAHKDHQKLIWHTVTDYSAHWSLTMQKMQFLDQQSGKAIFTLEADKKIIADSGTSFFLMPDKARNNFVTLIEKRLDIECSVQQLPVCSCPDSDKKNQWPDFRIEIDGKVYFMPFENYVQKQSIWGFEKCILKVMTSKMLPFYIMGLNFFENYYTVYDKEDKRVGFSISRSANSRIFELYEREAKQKQEETQFVGVTDDGVVDDGEWTTTSLCLGTLAASFSTAIAIVAYKKVQHEKQLNRGDYN